MGSPSQQQRPFPPLAYDPSAYEQAAGIPGDSPPWDAEMLRHTLRERATLEAARREIIVHYYRIGHTLAFPLPVRDRGRVEDLPAPIAGIDYPWQIWLVWELEERWRTLHALWRLEGDAQAGRLLQAELAALEGWSDFRETNGTIHLATGHLAAVLALALKDATGWEAGPLAAARTAADRLLEGDIAPWFPERWPAGVPLSPGRLQNIPVIVLARAAELARVRRHRLLPELDRQLIAILEAWATCRMSENPLTEGTAYDGYLMDSLTGWLAALPERGPLLERHRAAFGSLLDSWIGLSLPGRPDLHAPLGDVEPEMPHWIAPFLRLGRWLEREDALWLLRRIPPVRLPAAALAEAMALPDQPFAPPECGLRTLAHAVSIVTGWECPGANAILSVPRNGMGHLHADGGQFILGWQGRFWITDPGYQQYRPGEERDYSLGTASHNPPVINGQPQSARAAQIVSATGKGDSGANAHVALDLSACYPGLGLPEGAALCREMWAFASAAPLVVLRDRFEGLPPGTEIATHWLGGTHLAWSFREGSARLSHGAHALWVGTPGDGFTPGGLIRHPGSRGPLTLRHTFTLPDGRGSRWWVFCASAAGHWEPPRMSVDGGRLTLEPPGKPGASLVVG